MTIGYNCLFILVALLFMKKGICSEFFKSSIEVTEMFRLEKQLVNVLRDLSSQKEFQLESIGRYLKDYESVLDEKAENQEEFKKRVAGNPIHGYRLIKRLFFDWQTIEQDISDKRKNALEPLKKLRNGAQFPNKEDFRGALQALFRLQDTYELNITQLARGNIRGRQTRAELTAQDCFFVGEHAFKLGFLAGAVEWLEASYILARVENNQWIRQDQVMGFLQHAISVHDEVLQNKMSPDPAELFVFPLPLKSHPAAIQRKKLIRTRKYNLEEYDFGNEILALKNFNALCRGENLLNKQEALKLKCFYDDRNQPYFRLMPIQVEQHSLSPVIVTFHNILREKEIDLLKRFVKPKMEVSSIFGRKPLSLGPSGSDDPIDIRVSKLSTAFESHDPLLALLSKRIGLITGLAVNAIKYEATEMLVADYGIGGHFYPHHDNIHLALLKDMCHIQPDSCAIGERIATFQFYLNDVEQGGQTVFPSAGIAVPPIKGSAVFFYNLKRSGEPDQRNMHGSCPILFGHKWIATKWIGENAQTFNRPCALDPNE